MKYIININIYTDRIGTGLFYLPTNSLRKPLSIFFLSLKHLMSQRCPFSTFSVGRGKEGTHIGFKCISNSMTLFWTFSRFFAQNCSKYSLGGHGVTFFKYFFPPFIYSWNFKKMCYGRKHVFSKNTTISWTSSNTISRSSVSNKYFL